ncbi:DUF393 domain-containing protein [Thalassotalea sp. Y01]|uniref:thiol-disulfide oxidoreductase DCC family protein n=1 Tax=Thalassotalea sp. Y01 TaxID=2729613 RepID=UPI00145D8FC6|nr:DUF393 domain-containing protein [Thalassotalea sp. Y01]NMP17063.1 DUF393 domain-containing protein [Thalassotalea sp. Y01]
MLTIFYDANCPLCDAEMQSLKRYDTKNVVTLVDLHAPSLATSYPDINFEEAMKVLHGEYQGNILLGLEVTHRAWTLVGKGFWVAPLNWPVVKNISHWFYLLLAKYRHPISAALAKLFKIKTRKCHEGVCYNKSAHQSRKLK